MDPASDINTSQLEAKRFFPLIWENLSNQLSPPASSPGLGAHHVTKTAANHVRFPAVVRKIVDTTLWHEKLWISSSGVAPRDISFSHKHNSWVNMLCLLIVDFRGNDTRTQLNKGHVWWLHRTFDRNKGRQMVLSLRFFSAGKLIRNDNKFSWSVQWKQWPHTKGYGTFANLPAIYQK